MVIKMLLSSDIQKNICSNDFTSSKKKVFMHIIEKKKKKNLYSFPLDKISIRYEFSKLCFYNFLNDIFDK